jgi:type II secretory pathway pseudopilin PulG
MRTGNRGFTYLWLLLLVAISSVALVALGQVWHTSEQREREAELIYRGDQIARALSAYHAASGVGPPQWPRQLSELVEDKRGPIPRHHLRRLYSDPSLPGKDPSQDADKRSTGPTDKHPGDWGLVTDDKGAIVGVHSRSTAPAYIKRQEDEDSAAPVPAGSASQAGPRLLRDHRFMAGSVAGSNPAASAASAASPNGPSRPSWARDSSSAAGPSWARDASTNANKPSSSLFP